MILFKKIKNPIINFIISFALVYGLLYSISIFTESSYTSLLINQGNSYFESKVNKNYEYNRRVKITKKESTETIIHLQMAFMDKRNPDGSIIAKDIYSDMRNEAILPMLFLFSLIIATPLQFRRKMIALILGFILINIYIYIKLYVFAYDNYTHPDFSLIELSPLVSGFVYYGNKFLESTGASTNVIFPVIFWLISTWNKEYERILKLN